MDAFKFFLKVLINEMVGDCGNGPVRVVPEGFLRGV